MKLKKIIYAFFALALITAFFSGCSNLIDEKENSSEKKGRLLFSVNSSARNAITINPTAFDFENDSDLRFILTGTLDGASETETLGTWSDSDDGTKAYSLMTSDTSILVDTGTWTFRLSVRTKVGEEVFYEVLYGNLTKTIVQGNNSLDFGTLNEASEDDATRGSGAEVAQGSVSLKLSFPAKKVKSATGSLYAVGSDKTASDSENLTITASDDTDSVTFTKSSVDAGAYIVAIYLYTDDEKSYCTKYTALVVVAPGAESKAERSIDLLNALYTINYELEGGTFADSETITTSYNPCEKFTLPTPTRADYTFLGWLLSAPAENTVPDYAGGAEISISEDTTLYALWTPITYTITYELNVNDSAANSNVTTYTIEDDIKLSEPTCDEYVFCGWYESSDFSTSKITGWNAGDRTGNITLYAKWVEGIAANNTNIVEKIKAMTKSGILRASGEFGTDLIREINAALKELANTDGRSDVLVTLDLSEVTGLTELEAASYDKTPGYSFFGCTNLQGITLPDTITSIGESAFYGCTSLASITIPDSVEKIERIAFCSCTSLTSVTIPDSVTSIGDGVFRACTSLSSVTIGNSVTSIGQKAFYDCTALANVKFVDGTSSISLSVNIYDKDGGQGLFYDCPITELYIGRNIEYSDYNSNYPYSSYPEYYGYSAFAKNKTDELTVTIGSNVTSIGKYEFSDCTGLVSITIPDSVKSIGSLAFNDCTSLKRAYYTGTLEQWLSVSFSNESNPCCNGAELYINGTKPTDITIPDTITSIGDYAFTNCESLTSVTIPGSVTSIGYEAFRGCTSLSSVTIDKGVTSIGQNAFCRCTSLTGLTIPESVESIGHFAFYNCTSLTSVTISEGVNSIGYYAFYSTKPESLTIPRTVNSIGYHAFENCSNLKEVAFEDSENWYCSSDVNHENEIAISSDDLASKTTAAGYLTDSYLKYFWYKKNSE